MSISILLADDEALVRAGLRMILESAPDVTVVGEASDGADAVEAVERARPDVVLMDIRMPRLDGLAATAAIRRIGPTPRVLILTTFDLDDYVFRALQAGADGFLLKDVPGDQLVAGIRTVASGDACCVPGAHARHMIEHFVRLDRRTRAPPSRTAWDALTARELEILELMARGLSNAEIADRPRRVRTRTVKTHVAHVLAKLRLRDRVQAVVLAYETGIVQPGTDVD